LNGPVPLHDPFDEVSVLPTTGVPEIVGSPVGPGAVRALADTAAGIITAIPIPASRSRCAVRIR
jgi:hypothetical protein